MHRVVAAIIIGLLAVVTVFAQQRNALYLPLLENQTAVPIATATANPEGVKSCTTHEPDVYGEGLQAWLTDYNALPGTTNTLCVRFIRDGQPQAGVNTYAVVHYPSTDQRVELATTNAMGIAQLPFFVLYDQPDRLVVVDAAAQTSGRNYGAQTSFLLIAPPPTTPTATSEPTSEPILGSSPTPTETMTPTP